MPSKEKDRPGTFLLKPWPVFWGAVAGLGLAVLLQQAAVTPMTTPFLLAMVAAGVLVVGLAVPTTILLVRRSREPVQATSAVGSRFMGAMMVFVVLLVALVLATMGAHAQGPQQEGRCSASVNGQTASDRVVLPEDGSVEWELTSEAGMIAGWEVLLEYAFLDYPLDVGTDRPPVQDTKRDTASLDDYPRVGVGVYRLEGRVLDENGNTCTGTLDVVVPGNPLTAPMGLAATGLLALGLIGGTVSGSRAAGRQAVRERKEAEEAGRGDED